MPQNVTPQNVTPNLYHIHGQHLHMTYATTSLDGQPILTYQDSHQGKTFRGDEIRAIECDLGTLVSVTLRMTIDVGSTSLSLFIPRMRIIEGTIATVHTYCVTTLHSLPFVPQFSHEQLDTYSVAALHGTAQFVLS